MKKTIAMLIAVMFVVSLLPLAIAREGSDDSNGGSSETENEGPDDVNESDNHGMKDKPGDRLKIMRENIKEIRHNIKEKRQDIKEFRGDMKDMRKDRLDIFEDAKKLRKAGNTTGSIDKFKEFLLASADQWILEVEFVKGKVNNSTMNASVKAEIDALADAKINELESIKTEINAATTKEQLKEAAKKLRKARAESARRWLNLRVLLARIQGQTRIAENLEKRLDALSDKATEKGVNISADVDSFNAKVNLAKDKDGQVQDKLLEALSLMKVSGENNDEVKGLLDETKNLLKEAHDALKEAHQILKDIISKLKQANQTQVIVETEAGAEAED